MLSHEAGMGIAASRPSAYVLGTHCTIETLRPRVVQVLARARPYGIKGLWLLEQDSELRVGSQTRPTRASCSCRGQENIQEVPEAQREKER